ncbi:MAG: peptide chain release factor N(5)-glutamine methyltransferase [Candidatus Sumerlaeota bacterium]|nr:peptide chain release factor N(5)-glutamine methyltransferase [Candidatus Sumerlaeota bacterium]
MTEPLTIKDALEKSAEYLRARGSSSPRLDAELLLGHTLCLSRLQLYLNFDRPLAENEKEHYRALLKRRAEHEPVAYILGEKEFMSLPFHVTPAVLIPRPETEILVEEVMRKIDEWRGLHLETMPTVFEVGIGSGAISISLLHHFLDLKIRAGDMSASALEVAGHNARRHGVMERLTLLHGDLFAGEGGPFDFILSNPPYIAETERNSLAPDIVEHEPPEALFAGPEGLDVISRIIREGVKILAPDGWIFLEIGKNQLYKIKEVIKPIEEIKKVLTVEDHMGIVRVLFLQK